MPRRHILAASPNPYKRGTFLLRLARFRSSNTQGVSMQKTLLTIFCLFVVSGAVSADTKVKIRQTSGGQTYENTSYIKGKRQRTETNNGQMIVLQQCDLRRNIQIMPQAKA